MLHYSHAIIVVLVFIFINLIFISFSPLENIDTTPLVIPVTLITIANFKLISILFLIPEIIFAKTKGAAT